MRVAPIAVIVISLNGVNWQPARAESLLVIEPIVHEVLGNLTKTDGRADFIDCNNEHHDPTGKEIRSTSDRCLNVVVTSANDWSRFLNQPAVASTGDEFGTVTGLRVTDPSKWIAVDYYGVDGEMTVTMSIEDFSAQAADANDLVIPEQSLRHAVPQSPVEPGAQ